MPGKLADIDISAVEKLDEIKKQRIRLEKFVEKAKGQEDGISEIVYQKVIDDYQNQLERLAEDARPQKTDARQAYAMFRSLHEELEHAFEEARANKEELEFRHKIGEVSKGELGESLQACEQVLESCRSELADSDKLKKRFVNAFDSEDELELTTAPVPPKVLDETHIVDAGPVGDAGLPSTAAIDKTTLVAPDSVPPAQDELDSTFIVPHASLIGEADGEAPGEHALGALNYLGRTTENQIRIDLPGVSRKHALITASPAGFTLTDLESQNGTYVNDERITERMLEDGDRIRITKAVLVFRRA